MTEEELLAFISRILSIGISGSVNEILKELKSILERDKADEKYIELVGDLIQADREAAQLGKSKNGVRVTMDELAKAIREGRERIERDRNRC